MKSKRKNPKPGNKYRLNFERGNALILMAIAIPAIIGIVGLALDFGRGVWTQTRLQKAADAGALAGAAEMPYTYLAEENASNLVAANFQDPDGEVYTPLGGQYRVELSETIPTYFMKIFGRDVMDVAVTATAVIKRPVGGLRGGAFPFAILNPDLNSDPTDDLVLGNYGRPYIIMYGEDNIMVPDWANGSDPIPDPPDGNSRGWRGALGLEDDGTTSNDAGTDDIVYSMLNGWPGIANIGDDLPTKTGNMDNPINRARNDLLGDNPIAWEGFDPEIHANTSRVVMVPIVHLVNVNRQDTYTIQDYNNDAAWEHDYVVIDGFAPFFILTVSEQGDVDGDGNSNDRDWIVGYFIPGVETRNFLPAVPGSYNFGLYSPPRLVE